MNIKNKLIKPRRFDVVMTLLPKERIILRLRKDLLNVVKITIRHYTKILTLHHLKGKEQSIVEKQEQDSEKEAKFDRKTREKL